MRFEEAFDLWQQRSLTQEAAAQLLGVCERSFRRYIDRYEEDGLQGLMDKRMEQVSHRRAPVDEVLRLESLYRDRYRDWNVKHFYERYQEEHRGSRSYTWVKKKLQASGLVTKGRLKGKHRKRRDPSPIVGLMVHQDASTHEWVPGKRWDLVVTMDDANSEIYAAFFVPEEGTWSSFQGVRETIEKCGLFCSFYSDRGSHYWFTPEAGGKVDKNQLTQFGRAMQQLGIEMIAAYSPEARGRSERMFGTFQGRLPQELALAGITEMAAANEFLRKTFLPRFNKRFATTTRSRQCLCADPRSTSGRYPVSASGAYRSTRQLCLLSGQSPANPGRSTSLPLPQGQRARPRVCRWLYGRVLRASQAC
ncbi:MAG: ISNCY family transposase [Gammaproteobacteria bacterium]